MYLNLTWLFSFWERKSNTASIFAVDEKAVKLSLIFLSEFPIWEISFFSFIGNNSKEKISFFKFPVLFCLTIKETNHYKFNKQLKKQKKTKKTKIYFYQIYIHHLNKHFNPKKLFTFKIVYFLFYKRPSVYAISGGYWWEFVFDFFSGESTGAQDLTGSMRLCRKNSIGCG